MKEWNARWGVGLQRGAGPTHPSEEAGQGSEEEQRVAMGLQPLWKVLETERQQLRWLMKKMDRA